MCPKVHLKKTLRQYLGLDLQGAFFFFSDSAAYSTAKCAFGKRRPFLWYYFLCSERGGQRCYPIIRMVSDPFLKDVQLL